MNELEELQFDYKKAVTAYVNAFCKKHGWHFSASDWVAGDVGGVIEINDMFVNFDDIRVDIDNEFDKDAFEEWYRYEQQLIELGCPQHINYKSFTLGAPKPYSDEVLKRIEECRAELDKLINAKSF